MTDHPIVLFACIHNGGRSLAAKVLTEHHGHGRVQARSAGSEPGDCLFSGKRYEDGDLDDPEGQDLDTVRRIVDEVEGHVRKFLGELGVNIG